MAKGKGSKRGTRDAPQSLTVGLRSLQKNSPARRHLALNLIDDHRTFSFEPDLRPARLFSGGVASVGVIPNVNKQTKGRSRVPYQIGFTAPRETLVCVRRSRRKEVLFAKNKAGKRGQRKPRRSQWSNVKC